jgi:hypothetical protein
LRQPERDFKVQMTGGFYLGKHLHVMLIQAGLSAAKAGLRQVGFPGSHTFITFRCACLRKIQGWGNVNYSYIHIVFVESPIEDLRMGIEELFN